MSDHTFKPFDHELEALGRRVAEMGGVAEKMLADAMDGLFTFDVDMARRTIARDTTGVRLKIEQIHLVIEWIIAVGVVSALKGAGKLDFFERVNGQNL